MKVKLQTFLEGCYFVKEITERKSCFPECRNVICVRATDGRGRIPTDTRFRQHYLVQSRKFIKNCNPLFNAKEFFVVGVARSFRCANSGSRAYHITGGAIPGDIHGVELP
jgi:hypothetical protein